MAVATMMSVYGIVIAKLIKTQTIYLAIGSGLEGWDDLPTPPQPGIAQLTLNNELAREIATIEYVDASGVVSVPPTNRLRFSATFAAGVGTGIIREVGVFAEATGALDSGKLVAAQNIRPTINKTAGVSLSRLFVHRFL